MMRTDLQNANFSHANLTDADLRNSHLTGVNFANADLSGADLSGVYWDAEGAPVWPAGFVAPTSATS